MRRLLLALGAAMLLPAASDAHVRGCNTRACDHRVVRKHKLRVIAPYRSWLRSVGDCENGSYGGPGLREGLRAYNPAGPFYGRYQFTLRTWRAAGGHGDPRFASWLEQAYRAVVWRQRIGNPHSTAGWPECG